MTFIKYKNFASSAKVAEKNYEKQFKLHFRDENSNAWAAWIINEGKFFSSFLNILIEKPIDD